VGSTGFDAEFEVTGVAVGVEDFYKGGGDESVDVGADFFPFSGEGANG